MTDFVSVRDLSVDAVIGVHPWEREIEQTLAVSVEMVPETADVRKAATSDGLRALLDSIGPDPAAEELVANDLEFHRRIVACSGNSVLSSLLESMSGPTTRARVWRGLTQTGARARTLAEHRAIVDALAAHEPEVARSWATVHIAGVEQWLASVP